MRTHHESKIASHVRKEKTSYINLKWYAKNKSILKNIPFDFVSGRELSTIKMVDLAGIGSAAVAFLMYYNTMDAGFAYDDT